ncbi:MAG: amino acid permease [Duncaniella sp.]|nr:amino acid permease [Duncaniella sp.]
MANTTERDNAPRAGQDGPGVTASGRKKPVSTAHGSVTMMAMAILIITSVLSLRGLPSEAKFGVQSIFYYIFAALVFLVPFSLVCAELASTYTKSGGIYRWISEAFGPRWGWTAMYLEWQTVIIWFPTVLMFSAASLAYVCWPESFDEKLASNKIYTLIIAFMVYWGVTFNSFRGTKAANKLSTLGGLCGTIIPGAILIVLGIVYVCLGKTIELTPMPFFPDFSNLNSIVLAASIFLFYAGMEMQAVHINDMRNPSRDFPRAMLVSVLVIVAVYALGTLIIGLVIPSKDINLLQSLLVAYNAFWGSFGLSWLGNITALLIMVGVIGQVSALVNGPSTGLMAVAQSGYLPMGLQKTNAKGVNKSILIVAGVFVTVLTLILLLLPTVESAYQIMSQMATIIYLIMVLIIYGAFIRLRRTQPNKKRGFAVPGGKFGEFVVCFFGILGALAALLLSYLPPSQIDTGNPIVYIGIILIGVAIFVAIPLVIYALRKPSWRNPNAHFYPFDWQIEGRKPWEVSKWPAGYEPTEEQVEAAETDAISRHASEKHC